MTDKTLPDGSESSERIRLAGWLEFGCAHPEKLDMNAVRDAAVELRRLSAPAIETVQATAPRLNRKWEGGQPVAVQEAPSLTVWFDSMPESNGKKNWTVMLHRKGEGFENFLDGVTFERTEFYDRARYEADRLRYLIGEIAERPDILAYDPDMHAPPPVAPKAEQAATQAEAPSYEPCATCGDWLCEQAAPKAEPEYRIFKDGDQWCAVGRGFIDLQQSPAGFADTPAEAMNQLMKEFGKEWAAKNGEWVKRHSVEQAAPKAEPAILREVTDALRERIDFKSDIKVADLIRRAETVLAGHQGDSNGN
jgi:hypothetical protein